MKWHLEDPSPKTIQQALEEKAAIPALKQAIRETKKRKKRQAKNSEVPDYFEENFEEVLPTGRAFEGTPVDLHYILTPELKLYDWQCEELLRLSGHLDGYDFTDKAPCKYVISAANGSGKDEIIIARFVVWLMFSHYKSRSIITTASQTQLFNQTAPHIRTYVSKLRERLGVSCRSNRLHHFLDLTGSEIVMYVTNEPGRAEGYHPWGDGKMAIVVNEGKSVSEDIYSALYRCTGFSHFIQTSSPAQRRGQFYLSARNAVQYPGKLIPGINYFRRISAYECPHIPKSHIEDMIKKMPASWVASSINAEFSDEEDLDVVIPAHQWMDLLANAPKHSGSSFGIGLDIGKGLAETVCFVRQGNTVVGALAFREKNTAKQVAKINDFLAPYKNKHYTFMADDNGYGSAVIDLLEDLGWKIIRTTNQGKAMNTRKYRNFGAESYFHLAHLVAHKLINPSTHANAKLSRQVTSRRAKSSAGKFQLEAKSEVLAAGGESPDRADSFVLCFASFRSPFNRNSSTHSKSTLTPRNLQDYGWEHGNDNAPVGRPTYIVPV